MKKSFIKTVGLSIFLIILFRLVLPNGDEPDFHIRLHGLLNIEMFSPLRTLYETFGMNVPYKPDCTVRSSVTNFSGSITGPECFLSLEDYVIRALSHLFTMITLAMSVMILRACKFVSRNSDLYSSTVVENSVIASLLFPGYLYFIGLASVESLTLILSTLAILLVTNILAVIFLFLSVFLLDVGNSIVLLFFLFSYYGIFFLVDKIRKFWIILIITGLFIILLTLGIESILIFSGLPAPIGNKVDSIYNVLTIGSQSDLINKYPAFFRPLYTFSTLLLGTPNYLSSLVLFLFVGCATLIILTRRSEFLYFFQHDRTFSLFWAALSTIILITAVLPTYSYGKYYAFLIPVFIMPFVGVFGLKRVVFFCFITSIFTVINFSIFWI